MAGINFKAFDLGGHEIARRVWKDYYAKVCNIEPHGCPSTMLLSLRSGSCCNHLYRASFQFSCASSY